MAETYAPPSLLTHPYRLLFPIAIACGWVGVTHWFLYGAGALSAYSGLGHALILTQAMLGAFALGFAMTAIPSRTGTAAAHPIELALATLAPLAIAVAAQVQAFALAELAYAVLLGTLLVFSVRRTAGAPRRPPNSFAVIPIACLGGIAGAIWIVRMLKGVGGLEPYLLGREIVQQGVFLCLLIGFGPLILPLIAGARPPEDGTSSLLDRAARLGFLLFGVLLGISYWGELREPEIARGARAALVAIALVASGASRLPRKPGLHRWLATLAPWCAPAGLALAAIVPQHAVAMLHLVYIGCFSLLALAVSAHVALGHGGAAELMNRASGRAIALAALLALALAIRLGAHVWPAGYYELLALGALAWIGASVAWLALVGRAIVHPRPAPG